MSKLPTIYVKMQQFIDAQKDAPKTGSTFLMEWLKPSEELNVVNVNGVLLPGVVSIRTAYTDKLSEDYAQITFHNAADELIAKVVIRQRHSVELVPNRYQSETRYDLVVTPVREVTA